MLLPWLLAGDSMTLFGPASLHRSSHDAAPLLRVDVTPAGGAKADGLAADSRGRQLAAGKIENLKREVHKDLRRQAAFAHQPAKKRRTPRAENFDPITREIGGFHGLSFHGLTTCASTRRV